MIKTQPTRSNFYTTSRTNITNPFRNPTQIARMRNYKAKKTTCPLQAFIQINEGNVKYVFNNDGPLEKGTMWSYSKQRQPWQLQKRLQTMLPAASLRHLSGCRPGTTSALAQHMLFAFESKNLGLLSSPLLLPLWLLLPPRERLGEVEEDDNDEFISLHVYDWHRPAIRQGPLRPAKAQTNCLMKTKAQTNYLFILGKFYFIHVPFFWRKKWINIF